MIIHEAVEGYDDAEITSTDKNMCRYLKIPARHLTLQDLEIILEGIRLHLESIDRESKQ